MSFRILLIEDDREHAGRARRVFGQLWPSCSCEHADTLEAGLQYLDTEEVDVVLLALDLPDSRGTATLSRSLRHADGAAIIVLSADDDEARALEALEMGATEVMPKSAVDVDSLRGAIRRARSRARAQRVLMNQRLRESASLFRAVFDNMSSGVLVTNADGVVLLANASALTCIETDAERLIGHPLAQKIPGGAVLLQPAAAGERRQITLTGAEGHPRVIGFSSATVPELGYQIVVFRDVTGITESLNQQKRAERLAQAGMLVAKLSHEIKNPLASILFGLQSLDQQLLLSSEANEIMQSVIEEVLFLKTLIGDLLGATRPYELSARLWYLEPLVRDSVRSQRPVARRRGVDLTVVEGPTDLDAYVDQRAIQHILGNLIRNALDACERGQSVRVGWTALTAAQRDERFPGFDGEVVSLFVEDDGPGIPTGVLENLFVPFFSTKHQGTGLGMCIVQEMATTNGGVVHVQTGISPEGRGTRFEVFIVGGDRPSCREIHKCSSCSGGPCCPSFEGCPVRSIAGYHHCWVILGRVSRLERGRWNDECQECPVYRAGDLSSCYRAEPRPERQK